MTRSGILFRVAQCFASIVVFGCLTGLAAARGQATAPQATQPTPTTVQPVPRGDQWWRDRHAAIVQRVQNESADLVFIGDSITQGWEGEGRRVWEQRFAPRRAINLGFSGDRTQHVLWRLQNGEIDFPEGGDPKLAIIMIGTNNSNGADHTADEIAQGIEAIVGVVRRELPGTRILLLAIFPRGEKPGAQRDKNAAASARAARLADGGVVHFLDIGSTFLDADGTLPAEIMPDRLHLSAKGYELWADAIEESVTRLLALPDYR